MDRRAAGLVMVLLTLVAVLTLNGAIGRLAAGTAQRVPAPAPPVAGSCLVQSGGVWSTTPCSQPHIAEVAQSWRAVTLPALDLYESCVAAGEAYLAGNPRRSADGSARPATAASAWTTPPVMSNTTLVHGPGLSLASGWSWQACIVRPILPDPGSVGYRGRLADVSVTGRLPEELRPCFNLPDSVGLVATSCRSAHVGEVLASRSLQIFDAAYQLDTTATDPAVRSQCLAIARRATGTADPTYRGRLAVVVNLHANGMGFVVAGRAGAATVNASLSYTQYQASCSLQTDDGRQLVGSLIGLGGHPLPLQ